MDRVKKLNKWLDKPPKKQRDKEKVKTGTRFFFRYKMKPFLLKVQQKTSFIEHMPKSVVFSLFILFFVIVSAINNHFMTEEWKNNVVAAYPEIAQVDEKIQTSPLDKLFTEFVARQQALFFILFGININIFLRGVWIAHNARKPQSLRMRPKL